MEISVLIPQALRPYAQGDLQISVEEATSVTDLLAELQRSHPALYTCICDETGRLRRHINLFVGNRLLPRDRFATQLKPGDVISIFQAVSGG